MRQYERWLAWSGHIQFEDQPILWLGMGLVAARSPWRHQPIAPEKLVKEILTEAVRATYGHQGPRQAWRPPFSNLGRDYLGIPPLSWVRLIRDAFKDLAVTGDSNPQISMRLQLRGTTPPGAARAYRSLLLSGPWSLATTFPLKAHRAPRFSWPLRLGHMQENEPSVFTNARVNHWTTERLAEVVQLDRGTSNCDLLWFNGTMRELLRAVLNRGYSCKANIVIVLTSEEEDQSSNERELVADLLHASTFVALHDDADERTQGRRLNDFMKELSHNQFLDVALTRAFPIDASIHASDQAANYKLVEIVHKLEADLRALPGAAVESADFSRFSKIVVDGRSGIGQRPVGFDLSQLAFHQESSGASELVDLARTLDQAASSAEPDENVSTRRLQMKAYLAGQAGEPASRGFPLGIEATVAIRIGLQEEGWQAAPSMPREEFAQGHEYASLTVWLTEPKQLIKSIRRSIRLPATGSSEVCEFSFSPREVGIFDGRITVLHRGRVLQTARLIADVPESILTGTPGGRPRFAELRAVRHRMSDLGRRRDFDLSIITNHAANEEPRMVALSSRRAWIADTRKAIESIKEINTLLSEVAGKAKNYLLGLDGESGRAFIVKLARHGAELNLSLVNEQLARPGNNNAMLQEEYIQIVSTRIDAVVPFEFIYDFPPPLHTAQLCPKWRSSMETGMCAETCDLRTDSKHKEHVCPMGFWGQRKVIERHLLTTEHATDGKELFLQAEPGRLTSEIALKGSVVVASSKNVNEEGRKKVVDSLKPFSTFVEANLVKDWDEWKSKVLAGRPALILSMPHADVALGETSLEIGGIPMATIDIDNDYVRPNGSLISPIVALLGCDTAQTLDMYSKHVQWIRARGAAVVIGTISTVAGLQAPAAASLLARSILSRQGQSFFLGEAIRAMRREALLANELIPLALVAYGDADWKIKVGG